MAYVSLATLKEYLDISNTNDDTLLTNILTRAQAVFDAHFEHSFEAVTATRYYTDDALDGFSLLLDAPLLSVTTLTNGDGSTIDSSKYRLYPRNSTPYFEIRLLSTSNTNWTFDTDGEISVAGTWGYTSSAPDDVVHAVLRLAAYLYRQKDSQVFEATAAPELGIITVPKGIPDDVMKIIKALQAIYQLG